MKRFDWRFALARFIIVAPMVMIMMFAFAVWLYAISIYWGFFLILPAILVVLAVLAAVDWAHDYIMDKELRDEHEKYEALISRKDEAHQ
jgi:hypothetical protein